jgi:hypothetical protein
MPRFLTDQNFNGDILRGLLAREPSLEIVRTQDSGLSRTLDPELLEWAAHEGRVILTHDENSLVGFAYDRVRIGVRMTGVVLVHQRTPVAQAIDDVVVLAMAGEDADFDGQVLFIRRRT